MWIAAIEVEFSLAENALLVVIGVVSIVLTVAGVARQRRGDSVAIEPRPAGSGGYPDWLINLFRFPCPTSSATRAQVWFELKSSGLPVLAIGLGVALLIFLLFAISISVAHVRLVAIVATMLSVPIVLFILGSNAFGIRRKQGRTYASAFELTQPYGTAQLAGLKVLVRTACVLVALIAIGVSVWASSSLLGAWGDGCWRAARTRIPGLLKIAANDRRRLRRTDGVRVRRAGGHRVHRRRRVMIPGRQRARRSAHATPACCSSCNRCRSP